MTAAAVVLGSASAAVATPAYAPSVSEVVSESLQPVLHGVSNGASGADTLHFYARTVGATTWNVLNDGQQPGPDAYQQLPAGQLAIGQAFEYQVNDCDSTGCISSSVQTGTVSPALGAGERPGATRVPFTVGDRIAAQVDVGSGNLLLTTTQFSLPRRNGSTLAVGLAYNSVTRSAAGAFNDTSIAPGWRLSTATDVRLFPRGGGDVVYDGPNGLLGAFTPTGSGHYSSPTGFKMDLTAVTGGGWTLYDHGSGDTEHFNSGGIMTSLTDRTNTPKTSGQLATTFTYNASNALASISTDQGTAGANTLTVNHGGSFAGQVTGFTQNPDYGSPLASRSVSYGYDPTTGFLTSITDTLGRTISFGYGSNNNLNTITAPGGAQTSFTYDNNGRVQTVTQPTATAGVSAVTRFLYNTGQTLVADPNSNQSQTPDIAAHTTHQLTTDGQLLVASATDPLGNKRSATYTPFNDVASSTDASGQTTGSTHNANSGESLTGVTSPTGANNGWQYQNPGAAAQYEPSQSTDGQHNTSSYFYDGAGNGISATDAGNNKASVTRNPDGTVATSTTPSGAVTSYGYNSVGQQTSMTPPAGGTIAARQFSYDGFGRLATLTDGRGITTAYTYDAGDRITKVSYSDTTPAVSYAYNSGGQVQTRTDASGTTTYGYDPLGRLTSRSNTANTGGVSYTYDKAGNLATATNAAGTSSYTYDAREVVTSLTDYYGRNITFATDPNGRRTDTWFNTASNNTSFGAHTHTTYDNSGRITEVWTSEASNDNTKVSDLQYDYGFSDGYTGCPNPAGVPNGADTSLRWVKHNVLTNVYTNYCYDTSNRLLVADPGVGSTYRYPYDADGNRTQTTTNGTVSQTQTVNAQDQLTTPGYTYDADGNTTADSYGSHTYNAADQRTSFTSSGVTQHYTYAGTDQTELITAGNRNYTYGRTSSATGLPLVESFTADSGTNFAYLYDPNGTPLAITGVGPGSNDHYLALDGLGSVIATIRHDGVTTATYSYDPWGTQTAIAQNGSAINVYQLYGYAGGTTDPAYNGLLHLGYRWYDSTTGRFTQFDPTGQDPDYTYGADSPVTYTDPSGDCSPPYCRSLSHDAAAAGKACVTGVLIRAGVGGLFFRLFSAFRVTPAGLAVSCVTGIVGAVLRRGDLISTTPR